MNRVLLTATDGIHPLACHAGRSEFIGNLYDESWSETSRYCRDLLYVSLVKMAADSSQRQNKSEDQYQDEVEIRVQAHRTMYNIICQQP